MATWADIQSWELSYVEEAEDLIEAEVREAREIIADLEHAANDIRSQARVPTGCVRRRHRDPGQGRPCRYACSGNEPPIAVTPLA